MRRQEFPYDEAACFFIALYHFINPIIASIKNSIRNGWQGLFKPDGGNGRSQAENPARVRREDDPYSARSEFFDNSAPHAGAGSAAVASA